MKPWFEKEAEIIPFPKKPERQVIKMPSVSEYPDFITGVLDLQARRDKGQISKNSYDRLYQDLIHRFMKKESFETPWFLREDAKGDLKKLINTQLQKTGIKTTSSSRGGPHIRFPLKGQLIDFQNFFKPIGIKVTPADVSISGTYDTYTLTLTKQVGNIPAGTKLPWVNNLVGADSKLDKTFGPKELTPDSLGLANSTVDQSKILSQLKKSLQEAHPEQQEQLMEIAKRATGSGSVISLAGVDLSIFSGADIATISKNYGEVLSGLWSMKNLDFEEVIYPNESNTRLIDFYGKKKQNEYPVSVKSGGGGKVNIGNILDALQDKVKEGKVDPAEKKSYFVFKTVQENNAKEGILRLHAMFKTGPIKKLAQAMKTNINGVNLESVGKWLNGFKNNAQIKKALTPFLQSMNTQLTDEIWRRDDRVRFVVSPMGEWLWKFLNENEEIRGSMTELARQLSIIQVNIDIKKSSLIFQYNKFEQAEFIFGWAGYAAGNKLGFKMNLK